MIKSILENTQLDKSSILIKNNDNRNKFSLDKNDIFSAKIKDKNNETTTLATKSQHEFKAETKDISGDIGDNLFFQVVEKNKNGVYLKQIFPSSQKQISNENNIKNNKHLKELFIKNNFIDDSKKEEKSQQINKRKAIIQIKRKQLYGLNNTDISLVKELVANGINIEKIDFSLLFEMIVEINKTDIKKSTNLHERNIKIVGDTIEKLEKSLDLSPSEITSVLKNSGDITLNDIYFAKHSGNDNNCDSDKQTVCVNFINIEKELNKHFEKENIENNKENKEISKFLLENQLPINKENVDKTKFLFNISNEIDINNFSNEVINCIKSFKNSDEIVLFKVSNVDKKQKAKLIENYNEIIENLPTINTEKIDFLLKNQIPLSLFNLRNIENKNQDILPISEKDFQSQIISARIQIAEIQKKLTYEAATRLVGKGINIDTMPLEQALENLKALEYEKYEKNIKTMGGIASTENLNLMGNLYDKLNSVFPLTNNIFRDIILEKSTFTISNVDNLVNQARIVNSYENFMTVPNKKNGEVFAKIHDKISPFLENMGVAPTKNNIISFEILSKNKMDITTENIEKVKLTNNKIEYVANKLHPNIAVTIINQGINPLDMHIDELISCIDAFNNIFGKNPKHKIERYILDIDSLKLQDDKTRGAMLSVYRTLNQIQKENSVSLGVALKNNLSPTLGNLFEASKYFQKTRGQKPNINYEIDQNFGMLMGLKNIENTIKSTLNKGVLPLTNNDFEIRNFIDNIYPQNFAKLIEKKPEYMHMNIEDLNQFSDFQKIYNTEKFALDEAYKNLQETFQYPAKVINWMEISKIPTTVENLQIIKNFLYDPFYLGKNINRSNKKYNLNLDKFVLDKDLSLLNENTPEEILNDISSQIEVAKDNVNIPNAFKDFLIIQNGVKLQNMLQNRNENTEYHLPIKINNKIANLNIYILNPSLNGKSKLLLSLDMENLGDIQFFIEMNQDSIALDICCNNQRNLDFLENHSHKLIKYINNSGYMVNSMNFSLKEPKNMLSEDIFSKIRG